VALNGRLYTSNSHNRDPLAREGHRTDMKGFVMASAAPFPAGSPLGAEHRGNLAQRYPLTMFVALLGSSLLVTWLADG
jgi:hypothetical protein